MSIEYKNNIAVVKEEMRSAVKSFCSEAGSELKSQTQRNSRVDTGQTKGSYHYRTIDRANETSVAVGSDYENAIWEEFGTGEYALKGDGRKGGWVYKDEKGNFHKTKGKTPNRPLYNAFVTKAPALENGLAKKLKSSL